MVAISRCVTEALRYVTVVHDLSRLLAVLLRHVSSVAIGCVLTLKSHVFFPSVKVSYGRNINTMQFKAFYVPFI